MKSIRFFLAMIMFMGVLSVMAQSAETPRADQREQNQRARIREGERSGELTRRESARARRDQREIRRTEKRAKADGEVTKKEKAVIEHKQDKASRKLRRNKHDVQERPSAN